MRSLARLALLAQALALAGCLRACPGPATPGSAEAPGAVAAVNATPTPPPVLDLEVISALASSGLVTVHLAARGETSVEPRATFRVELPVPLADARLTLLDGGDALVASAGTREIGPATILTLTPAVALPAGARYRLRVDGAAVRELQAADGRRFSPVEWPVVVAGEPPAKKSPPSKAKRR